MLKILPIIIIFCYILCGLLPLIIIAEKKLKQNKKVIKDMKKSSFTDKKPLSKTFIIRWFILTTILFLTVLIAGGGFCLNKGFFIASIIVSSTGLVATAVIIILTSIMYSREYPTIKSSIYYYFYQWNQIFILLGYIVGFILFIILGYTPKIQISTCFACQICIQFYTIRQFIDDICKNS